MVDDVDLVHTTLKIDCQYAESPRRETLLGNENFDDVNGVGYTTDNMKGKLSFIGIVVYILLSGCKPVIEVGLGEYNYREFDYEVFLEGNWEEDSLKTSFVIKGKQGKGALSGFRVQPESMQLYSYEDGRLEETSYESQITVSKGKEARLLIQYSPKFKQIFPCTLSFLLNERRMTIRAQPTNYFVSKWVLDSNKPLELSKSRGNNTCIVSFPFRFFNSAYVYDSMGNMVIKKDFDENYNGIDVVGLPNGEYLLQLNGQYRPEYVTLRINK